MPDTNVTIDLATPEGSVSDYCKILAAYSRYSGKSFLNCCYQVMVQTLKSLHRHTAKAKFDRGDIDVSDTDYRPSYKREPGSRISTLCARTAGGQEVRLQNAKYLCLRVTKKEQLDQYRFYRVVFKYGEDGYDLYHVAARTERDARKWAENRLRKHLKRFAGLAKTALKTAQGKLWQSQSGETGNNASRQSALVAQRVSEASKTLTDGELTINVRDKLDYAASALETGYTVRQAVNSAYRGLIGEALRKTSQVSHPSLAAYLRELKKDLDWSSGQELNV